MHHTCHVTADWEVGFCMSLFIALSRLLTQWLNSCKVAVITIKQRVGGWVGGWVGGCVSERGSKQVSEREGE